MRITAKLLVVAALASCSGDDDAGSTSDAGQTGDAQTTLDATGSTTTYHLLDLDAGCTDHVIAELAFDTVTQSGTFTTRACAPSGAPSGAASSIEYHPRFSELLVADGHVLVKASESDAAMGIAPVVYCREAPTQSTIELLRFALSSGLDTATCNIRRTYRDPVDGYYNSGVGSDACSSLSYMRSATRIVWMDSDRIGADIALDQGSATAGHPGVATLTLTASSGATIMPAILCWTN